MFTSFQESLEARFTSIDNRFSHISSSSASLNQDSNVSCQDAINRSFRAPSPVAVRSEYPPDRGPSAPYLDGLGRPATVSTSDDATSLPRMAFADLLATIQLLESRGRVPDAFLDTLLPYVIVASDFDIAINGTSLAGSIRAFRVPDPLHPVPGPPHGGDSIVPFFYRLLASLGSSLLVATSTSSLHHGGGGGGGGCEFWGWFGLCCSSF